MSSKKSNARVLIRVDWDLMGRKVGSKERVPRDWAGIPRSCKTNQHQTLPSHRFTHRLHLFLSSSTFEIVLSRACMW